MICKLRDGLQATAKRAAEEEERREETRLKTEQETLRKRYEEEHVAVAAEAKAVAVRKTCSPHPDRLAAPKCQAIRQALRGRGNDTCFPRGITPTTLRSAAA